MVNQDVRMAVSVSYAEAARICREFAIRMVADVGEGSSGEYAALQLAQIFDEISAATEERPRKMQ